MQLLLASILDEVNVLQYQEDKQNTSLMSKHYKHAGSLNYFDISNTLGYIFDSTFWCHAVVLVAGGNPSNESAPYDNHSLAMSVLTRKLLRVGGT